MCVYCNSRAFSSVMDKSWIKMPRNTLEYQAGLNKFLDFAFEHDSSAGTILCPCHKCSFRKWKSRQEVFDDLMCKPFPQSYTFWDHHGETLLNEPIVHPSSVEENLVDEDHMTSDEDHMVNRISLSLELRLFPWLVTFLCF